MCEKTVTREEQIQRAFKDLRTARTELHEVSEEDLKAREALKIREAGLMLSGAIIGKNAETRAAELKNGCTMELAAVEAARVKKGEAQLRMDLASMRVQELQWLIRNEQAEIDWQSFRFGDEHYVRRA
ncbi:hypothetical protein M0R72_19890 [Candidatus Pacearchaeota archaeon]|jgi:hypothetical protein|nr:hypothetical protein [Candidatus Pacearchaeota archaeon]